MSKNIVDDPSVVSEVKNKVVTTIKNYVFDLVGIVIIIAMFLLGLGALQFNDVTWATLLDVVISFIPFYICMQVLNLNYYTKGVFKGKATEVYRNAMTAYSEIAGRLTGEQQDTIYEFCEYYNDNALRQLQTSILKRAAITYDLFAYGDDNTKALMTMTKQELSQLYNKDQVKLIIRAKNAHIKGISANILLSNIQSIDNTDIGKTEQEMRANRTVFNSVMSFASVLLLCLIELKDLQEWGWLNAALILFKMVYIFARSYIQYFTAYNDIIVNLVNHLARKSDILKQFEYWHSVKYSKISNSGE